MATSRSPPRTGPRRCSSFARRRWTWSSSTSGCPTFRAWRSSASCATGAGCRWSCSRRGTAPATRSRRWTPARTTTSPSRSASTSCSPGCAPPYAVLLPAQAPRSPTGDLRIDLEQHRVWRGGEEVRLTPTEWGVLAALVTRPGRLVPQRQLLHEVWGPAYETGDQLPARLRRQPPPQARVRPVPAPAPDHRAGDGLPLRPLTRSHHPRLRQRPSIPVARNTHVEQHPCRDPLLCRRTSVTVLHQDISDTSNLLGGGTSAPRLRRWLPTTPLIPASVSRSRSGPMTRPAARGLDLLRRARQLPQILPRVAQARCDRWAGGGARAQLQASEFEPVAGNKITVADLEARSSSSTQTRPRSDLRRQRSTPGPHPAPDNGVTDVLRHQL